MKPATPLQTAAHNQNQPDQVTDLAVARKVLAKQQQGLHDLSDQLGQPFIDAVALLLAAKGRVIITGVGKSGHVGCKIAATLASTGTPAQFVHAAEASHGDMGMITAQDVILALSNSGETKELADIITYAKRFSIPLLAMTSRADSALAKAATLALVMPAHTEGCRIGMAPTTSTTLMMAYGDALAVALMARRDFSASDFKVYHPGGKLGQQLLRVEDLMHIGDALPLVDREMLMADVLVEMTQKSLGCAGVVDQSDGQLVGVITDGDLRRHMNPDLMQRPAREVMSADPVTITRDKLASEAMALMQRNPKQRPISGLFVLEAGKPVGFVHLHDCLRAGLV